jgi:nucleotide-binding universal stress UspA family protein
LTADRPSAGPALLVGYDGSDGGKDALELARVLHPLLGGPVLVATVLLYGPQPRHTELSAEERAIVGPLFEQARVHIGVSRVETRALAGGSPGRMLTECAEAERVGTIVLGSPHRGPIGRALIGSVARGVLHGAPCEVAVAPRAYAGQAHPPCRTIAVAYDGSPEAKAALRRAEDLARPSQAAIKIFTVAPPPTTVPSAWGIAWPEPSEPDRVLSEAIDSVDPALAVRGWRFDGPPAATLAKACEDDVDLLVAGSRGYGPLARVLLGSVTWRLVEDAPCPVLVVPRHPGPPQTEQPKEAPNE